MRSADALAAFEGHLRSRQLTVDGLDAPSAINTMLTFYAESRAEDVVPEPDGDMLLFQWAFLKRRPGFEYNITRQLIIPPGDDDEDIWQLSLSLYFPPDSQNAQLGSGNRWHQARTASMSSRATSARTRPRPMPQPAGQHGRNFSGDPSDLIRRGNPCLEAAAAASPPSMRSWRTSQFRHVDQILVEHRPAAQDRRLTVVAAVHVGAGIMHTAGFFPLRRATRAQVAIARRGQRFAKPLRLRLKAVKCEQETVHGPPRRPGTPQQPGQRRKWPTSSGFPLAAQEWLSPLSDGPAIKASYRGTETTNLPVNRRPVPHRTRGSFKIVSLALPA
jgi:hypothetical protein